jgi:1-acyl-sn-glycerol-3-phosphate acyltransferase
MALKTVDRHKRVAQCLLERGRYETDMSVYTRLQRILKHSQLAYHIGNTAIVARGGRFARRGKWDNDAWTRHAIDILSNAELAGAHMTVENASALNVLLDEPGVVVGNHMSSLDTFIMPGIVSVFRPVTVVIKEVLMKYPLLGPIMCAAESIPVGRRNPREDLKQMLEGGMNRLERGKAVVIFPQSTRLPGLSRSQFNSVGVKLAKRAGVKVIPVALQTDFHSVGKVMRDFGHVDRSRPVRFAFGDPVTVEGNGKAAHEACVAFIADTFNQWGLEVTA